MKLDDADIGILLAIFVLGVLHLLGADVVPENFLDLLVQLVITGVCLAALNWLGSK